MYLVFVFRNKAEKLYSAFSYITGFSQSLTDREIECIFAYIHNN